MIYTVVVRPSLFTPADAEDVQRVVFHSAHAALDHAGHTAYSYSTYDFRTARSELTPHPEVLIQLTLRNRDTSVRALYVEVRTDLAYRPGTKDVESFA